MKKTALLYSKPSPSIDAIKFRLNGISSPEEYTSTENLNPQNFDLIILCGYEGKCDFNAINIHHSLLPSYKSKDPVQEAIFAGAKVTGLTIFYTNPFKIITQYPVFVYNDAHYDELKQELIYLEQTIYPLVIEKILKNEQFEIRSLLAHKEGCAGNCKECAGCRS